MSQHPTARTKLLLPLVVLFFLSGVSGLIYQVVWFRMLTRSFGVTVYAVTTVLVVFMGGLAFGSLGAARLKRSHALLTTYAITEILIGVFAAISSEVMGLLPTLFASAVHAVGPESQLVTVVRVALSCLVLMPPTLLMGATLPMVSGYLSSRDDVGRQAGTLYGMNTLGAVVGVVATGFVLIAALGEQLTIVVGVALNVIVGVVSLMLSRWSHAAQPTLTPDSEPEPPPSEDSQFSKRILIVALLSGACALSFEVIWSRVLTILLGNSVYGFSSMLGSYLIGIGVGSAVMARNLRRVRRPTTWFASFEMLNALLGLISLHAFLALGIRDNDAGYTYALIWGLGDFGRLMLYSVLIVLPVTLVYGAIFPVASALVASGRARPQEAVGKLYGYNTVGGILGSVLAGFILIPWLGTLWSFLLMSLLSLLIGVYVHALARKREGFGKSIHVSVGALVVFFALAALSLDDPFVRVLVNRVGSETNQLIEHREDRGATISVFEDKTKNKHTLYINGLYVSNTFPGVGEEMINLPLAFHPDPGPKNLLVVGLGVGESLEYAIDAGHRITVVELHRAVVGMYRNLESGNDAYLANPNARIVINDGRNHLLHTDEKYDLILVDGSPPVYASGMVNLYSLEFARLARERLTPRGLFVIWFPVVCFEADFWMVVRNLSETYRTLQVFSLPQNSNAMLMASMGEKDTFDLSLKTLSARLDRWNAPRVTKATSVREGMLLREEDIRKTAAIYATVTDDRPYTEFPFQRFWRGEVYHRDNRFLYPGRFPNGSHRCRATDANECEVQCAAGQPDSCLFFGHLLERASEDPANATKAAAAYERACFLGFMPGCSNLGVALHQGKGVERDLPKAASMYRVACAANVVAACNNLGVMLSRGEGIAKNEALAVGFFEQACDGESMAACTQLGVMAQEGSGLERDERRAVLLFRRACDRDHMTACSHLGVMLGSGRGVARDDVEALAMFEKACKAGRKADCFTVGLELQSKRMDADDAKRARERVEDACKHGIDLACYNLKFAYDGPGTRSVKEVADTCRERCEADEMDACAYLGFAAVRGRGVERDEALARDLFRRACDGGDKVGCSALTR